MTNGNIKVPLTHEGLARHGLYAEPDILGGQLKIRKLGSACEDCRGETIGEVNIS